MTRLVKILHVRQAAADVAGSEQRVRRGLLGVFVLPAKNLMEKTGGRLAIFRGDFYMNDAALVHRILLRGPSLPRH
jgi:hypothetical protein